MNHRVLAGIAVLVCLAFPVRANWGDSLEQCIKQYGKPTNKFLDEATGKVKAAVFAADDLIVTVSFRAGKAFSMDYRGKDGKTLSIAQILAILLAHETAGGRFYPTPAYEEPIKPLPVKDHARRLQSTIRYRSWVRSDHKLLATFVQDKGALRILPAPEIKTTEEK